MQRRDNVQTDCRRLEEVEEESWREGLGLVDWVLRGETNE